MDRLTHTATAARWLAVTVALLALGIWLLLYGADPVDLRRMR